MATRLDAGVAAGGYYLDLRAKAPGVLAREEIARQLPAQLAQTALAYIEHTAHDGSWALPALVDVLDVLTASAVERGGELWWTYDVALPKYGLEAGWSSAMAQGQAASALVRAAYLLGDERYAAAARRAVSPLLRSSRLVVTTPDGPVLEEAPTDPPSFILNGWIFALWGLRDVAVGLRDSEAGRGWEAGVRCLEARLPRYDAGWWSLYSEFPHRLRDLAKPFYHRLHVTQLRVMHSLTGAGSFADVASSWHACDTRVNTIRAVLHKVAFVGLR